MRDNDGIPIAGGDAAEKFLAAWRSVGAALALWGVVGLLIGCAFKLGNRRKLPG
jgi:hypothetical protein